VPYRYHTQSINGEKRLEQIRYSQKAMNDALKRRGMDQDYELEFQLFADCYLIKKN
jgi:hypothetical protein